MKRPSMKRPSAKTILRRFRAIQARERASTKEGWYWLSYSTEEKFVGGSIVRAHGVTDAIGRAIELDIDPGRCQVMGQRIPSGAQDNIEYWANRMLTPDDVQEMCGPIPMNPHDKL